MPVGYTSFLEKEAEIEHTLTHIAAEEQMLVINATSNRQWANLLGTDINIVRHVVFSINPGHHTPSEG